MLSNTVQNAIIGPDNSLLGGLLGAAVLLAANYTTVRLGFQYPALARALEGTPTTLVQNGKMLEDNLRRYLITREELMAGRSAARGAATSKTLRWWCWRPAAPSPSASTTTSRSCWNASSASRPQSPTVRTPGPHAEPLRQPTSLPGRGSGLLRLAGSARRQPARSTDGRWPGRRPSAPTSSSPARATCTTQPERTPAMLSFYLASLFGRGHTRALVDSPLAHAPIESHREGRTAARNRRTQAPPFADRPIDDRDRVESGSPLPRRLTVAIP